MLFHSVIDEERSWSRVMKGIIGVLKEDTVLTAGFKDHLVCEVGNEQHIRFWSDPWADSKALSLLFPRLFANCTNKTAWVHELGLFVRGKWVWDIPFRRPFFGWETEIFDSFMTLINSRVPAQNAVDHLFWCVNSNGWFNIKGLCEWAEDQFYETEEDYTPEGIRKCIPPKVSLLF